MQSLRTAAPRAACNSSHYLIRQQPRRLASGHHDPHTSHSTTGGAEPGTESFGRGFYLFLFALPLSYAVYTLSRGDQSNSPIAKLTTYYNITRSNLAERNALHTRMVEQAAQDRNLFLNANMPNHFELRAPENITASSPINVPAGQGSADMSGLIAHYQSKSFEDEREKRRLMGEGRLPVQVEERERAEEVEGNGVGDRQRRRVVGGKGS